MNIKVHTNPFHYIEIENLYNEEETNKMLDEMIFLQKKGIFLLPEQTGTAKNEDGRIKKKNSGLWIDDVFKDRHISDILTYNRRLFDALDSDTVASSWFFKNQCIQSDYTLLSYYENSDYYESHVDSAVFTSLTWFYKTPKMFEGGDLTFTDYNLTINCKRNYTIVFPSNIHHEVSEVKMDKEFIGNSNGRFVMTQFGHEMGNNK